jgi:hypothetical protein
LFLQHIIFCYFDLCGKKLLGLRYLRWPVHIDIGRIIFKCSILSSSSTIVCPFSLGRCIVCLSSIHDFWLPLWYLQTFHVYCLHTYFKNMILRKFLPFQRTYSHFRFFCGRSCWPTYYYFNLCFIITLMLLHCFPSRRIWVRVLLYTTTDI